MWDKSGIRGGGWNDGGECEGELSGSWAVDIEAQCAISSLSDSYHLGEQSSEANLGTSLPLPLTALQCACHQSLTFFFISVLLVTFPNLSLTSLPVSPLLLYCPQEGTRTEYEISKLCPQWSLRLSHTPTLYPSGHSYCFLNVLTTISLLPYIAFTFSSFR